MFLEPVNHFLEGGRTGVAVGGEALALLESLHRGDGAGAVVIIHLEGSFIVEIQEGLDRAYPGALRFLLHLHLVGDELP